jgi:hypothetical protein
MENQEEQFRKLTKEIALSEIEEIKNTASDDEAAHSMEDSLYLWFVECAANGMYEKEEMIEVASVVVTSQDIEFARWRA